MASQAMNGKWRTIQIVLLSSYYLSIATDLI